MIPPLPKVVLPSVFFFSLTGLAAANSIAPNAAQSDRNPALKAQATRTSYRKPASDFAPESTAERFREYAAAAAVAPLTDCGFANPCYSTTRAPEPQSLFLVGSGLIAMAGLIRRRWAR